MGSFKELYEQIAGENAGGSGRTKNTSHGGGSDGSSFLDLAEQIRQQNADSEQDLRMELQRRRQEAERLRNAQTVQQLGTHKTFYDQAVGVPMQKDFSRQTPVVTAAGMEQQKKFHDAALGKSMGLAGTEAEKTARQAAAAEKAYNDYLASDEYKTDKAAAVSKAVSDASNEAEYYAAEQKQPQKEQELKSAMEYWQQEANKAQSAEVTTANMEEFQTWPEADQNALKKAVLGDTLVLGSPVSVVMSHLTQNSLAEKYGKEKVEEMAESLRRYYNQQATEKVAEVGTEFAKTGVGKWLGQSQTVAGNLIGSVTSPLGYADEFLRGRTGQYPTMDPNNAGNLPNVFASAFRQQVASDIEGDEGSKARKALSYGYQGLMGAADSLIRVVATGGTGWASLGLAAAGSFGQTISEASKQGATPGQAVLLATATAGLEAATEKLPLDELLKTAKGGAKPAMQMIGTALKQTGIEVTTEELSFLGSLAAEAAILREKSGYRQQIGELVANGMSYEEAKAEADRTVLEQAKQTAIVSGLSGAFSSFAGSVTAKATAPETGAQEGAEEAKKPLDVFRLTRGLGPKTTTAEAPKNEALKRYLAAFEHVTGYDKNTAGIDSPPDVVQGQNHLPESQIYNWGIKKDAPLGGTQPVVSDSSRDASSGVSDNSIHKTGPVVNANNQSEPAANPAQTKKESGASAIVADGQERPEANSTPNSSENSVTDGGGVVNENPGRMEQGDGPVPEGFEAMGAASAGFSGVTGYDELLYDGNVQPARATDAKYEEMPIRDGQGRTVTEFGANVINSEVISERDVNTVKQLVADGAFGHDVQTMEEVYEAAVDRIKEKKPGRCANKITGAVADGKFDEHTVAEAQVLFAYYTNRKGEDAQARAEQLLVDLAQMATSAGRQLNMFKLLRRLTPEGQLNFLKGTVKRQVDKINENRSGKKQVDPEIPEELSLMYLDASKDLTTNEKAAEAAIARTVDEGLMEDAEAAADSALAKIPWFNPRPRTEANIATNDLVERMGQRVSDSLTRQARERNISTEDLLYQEIMRFANDKADAGRGKTEQTASTANLDAMRDYYRYRPFFQNVWNVARDRVEQAMFSMQDGDPRIAVIEQFLASGDEALGIENWKPIGAMDYANPDSTVRRGAKEAATVAGIRMDNSRPGGEQEVRQKMRDVLIENARAKEAAARQIAGIAVRESGLSDDAADALARDVVRAFYNDLAQQSAKRVAQMFGTDKKNAAAVEKTMLGKLGELYNMGAFSDEQFRQAAFDSVFGENSGITVSDELMEKFVNAAKEKQDAAADAIYAHVAAQIPGTLGEKVDAWRHMCMLGNIKTQERNFIGTGVFRPMVQIRRGISAAIQRATVRQENRTRAILGVSRGARELVAWAREDAKSKAAQNAMKYSGYTGNQARSMIEDHRRIFKSTIGEKARTGLQGMMESADMVWKKAEYATSLASFLKARGYTAEQVRNGAVPAAVMAEGRGLAVQDAMEATFNDSNRFSDTLSRARFKGSGLLAKAGNILIKGTVPYIRTPVNVVVRVAEYSPAGLARALLSGKNRIDSGKATAAQVMDEIAAGLTGSAAMGIGAAMQAGLIPGVKLHGDVSEEEDENGILPYSVQIGDTCYSLEWLCPTMVPMFTGANLARKFDEYGSDGNLDGWDIVSAFLESTASAVNPVLEMSVLSSLNDLVQNVAYEETAGDKAIALVTSAVTNYMMQFLPTLGGHLERTMEDNQKTAYSDADNAVQRSVEKTIGRATQKIPGVDLFQADKVDSHGDVVRYGDDWVKRIVDGIFSPSTTAKVDNSIVATEIGRLNQVQKQNVSEPAISQSISYTDTNGVYHEKQRLTAEQYATLQSLTRRTSDSILEAMFSDKDYQALTEDQKAEAVGYAYDYAREKGRAEAIEGYPGMSESWMEGIAGREVQTIIAKAAASEIGESISNLTTAWENGWNTEQITDNLEDSYAAYEELGDNVKTKIDNQLTSQAEKYVGMRNAGISADKALDIGKLLNGLIPKAGKSTVTASQQAEAIAGTNLTNSEMTAVMKLYLNDTQDQNIDDMAAMGYSAKDYSTAYNIYTAEKDKGGEGTKTRTIEKLARRFGVSRDTAAAIYEIYG